MYEKINEFISELQGSLAKGTFVKLTLANYKGSEDLLQKIQVRRIDTKKGARLFVQFKYETRDISKTFGLDEGVERIAQLIESGFRNGHLFTAAKDFQLTIGKRNARISTGRPAFKTAPPAAHDREKRTLMDPSAFYLKELGITNDGGKIRSEQRDKWKQINKFVEVLDGLFRGSELAAKKSLRIIDMGSGKGYLTFAAYDHFANTLRLEVSMTGVDSRSDMVELCNSVATAGDFQGLRFEQGTIDEFKAENVDILIALHACDTATDDALFKGIRAGAQIIIAAPCCHHEVRDQLKPPVLLSGVLKHAVLLERTAETLTDGVRSMLLENSGYSTKMFEFVPTEHTPKNNLLVAIKQAPNSREVNNIEAVEQLMSAFEVSSQRLYHLLQE